ncbi:MAG: ATP cone domain-containing protein [Gemmataceae bacterium]
MNATPPGWVYKRDGRLVPFEPDRIARGLFLASQRLGRPDSFLARELTDSVLHFLTLEAEGTIPTTVQISELVEKVVRELGQPELARAYAEQVQKQREALFGEAAETAPRAAAPELDVDSLPAEPRARERSLGRAWLRDWSLAAVFSPELAAAHRDGLIVLGGLDTPFELAACTADSAGRLPVLEAFEACRALAGQRLALDGPEHWLVHQQDANGAEVLLRELALGVRASGLEAVVNLNSAEPPVSAEALIDGPLFAACGGPAPARLPALVDELLAGLLALESDTPVRINWHLQAPDFEPAALPRLSRLLRRAGEGKPIAFVFDRARQPALLDEGIERGHAAVLLEVGLDLPRLATLVDEPSAAARAERYLHRLGSVVRLALSAGKQKRQFLRQRKPNWPAFLLDRARLLIVPHGLEAVVRDVFGQSMSEGGPGLEFARHVIERIAGVLNQDGQAAALEACLGGQRAEQAGVTPWDQRASLRNQLRAAGRLHAGRPAGTAFLHINDDEEARPERLAELLHAAWKQTEVARIEFVGRARPAQQYLASEW